MGDMREDLQAALAQHGAEKVETEGAATSGATGVDAPLGDASPVDARPSAGRDVRGASDAPAQAAPPSGPAPGAREGRDEKGRFAPRETAKDGARPDIKPESASAGQAAPQAASPADAPSPAPPVAPALKPPQSWKPGVRERWASLPADVQAEVVRRERETTSALQEAADARKNWQAFQSAVAPYEGMIRSEGGEPLRAVTDLLQTAAALRTAPPAHKAHLVATIVQRYNVPIDALDAALAGQSPGPGTAAQGAGAPQAFQDPRLDQLLAQLQSAHQQRQQTLAQQRASEVAAFAETHEFYEDVKADMADLIEVASRRGVALSLEDAYSRAVRGNPDVWPLLQQREAAKAANVASTSTQRARDAASSVKSQPAGSGNGALKPSTLRGDLEAAFAAASGR